MLNLKVSLEDDSEIDYVEEVSPVEEEIEELSGTIEETSEQMDAFTEVITNLSNLRNHIKKFGVTKEFLHLVNGNNNLGKALGLQLPYYEDDEIAVPDGEIPEITEEMLPAEEVIMESFEENIKKMINWVIEKFKALINFSKELFNKFLLMFKNLDEAVANLAGKARATKKDYGDEVLKNIKLKGIALSDFQKQWNLLMSPLQHHQEDFKITLAEKEGDPLFFLAFNHDDLNEGLSLIGKQIEVSDQGNYSLKNITPTSVKATDSNAYDLGYDRNVFINFRLGHEIYTAAKNALPKTIKSVEKGRDSAIIALKKHPERKTAQGDINRLKGCVKVAIDSYNLILKESIKYIKFILALGIKFNF